MPPSPRPFTGGSIYVELDGAPCGVLKSVEGGGIKADVIREPAREANVVKKRLGAVIYEDVTIRAGGSMTDDFFDWISKAFTQPTPRNVSLVTVDQSLTRRSTREFRDALITEITFPALDGSSKDAAFLTVTITPQFTSEKPASGKAPVASKAKNWMLANFRLAIDGLDCTRVSRIESFTIKQQILEYPSGFSAVDVSDLRIALAEASSETWVQWHEDFVIDGKHTDDDEKKGTVELLTADLKKPVFTVTLRNLGIFRLAPTPFDAGADQVRRLIADLYCERMEFGL